MTICYPFVGLWLIAKWMTYDLCRYISCQNPFWPAFLDSERLTFKNSCVKSNKHRPCYQRQKSEKCSSMTSFSQYKLVLDIRRRVSRRSVFKPGCGRWNRRICSFPVDYIFVVSEITSALIAHCLRRHAVLDFCRPAPIRMTLNDQFILKCALRAYVVAFGADHAWLYERGP